MAECVIECPEAVNVQQYDSARQALMKAELVRIRDSGELSSDVFEVVSKSLAY